MEKNRIADKIFHLRQERGLSQKSLGEELGYAQRTISDWENANTVPNIDAIRKIASFFDVSYEELLDNK